jgi:hypothetical protein
MSGQQVNPEGIRRAEALVSRLHGISSCRITTDPGGEVTEVHVVSNGGKAPKLVARDVESLLKAEMGIDLDYRKIGVVSLEAPNPPSGAPVPAAPADHAAAVPPGVEEFPVEEYASRFAFHSVNLFMAKGSVKAEVELMRDSVESFGSFESDRTTGEPWSVIAEATLRAVAEFLDEKTRLCLGEVLKVAVGDKHAFVVRVDMTGDRDTKSLAGCSIVSGNENQSVVYATLDAVNRVIGKLDFKSFIEYKIR